MITSSSMAHITQAADVFMTFTMNELSYFIATLAERGLMIQVVTVPYETVNDAPAHQDRPQVSGEGSSPLPVYRDDIPISGS